VIIKYTRPASVFNIFYLAKTFLTMKIKCTNTDKFDGFVTTKRSKDINIHLSVGDLTTQLPC